MPSNNSRGLIFLSHAKEDAAFISEVISSIPKSHIFHDLSSMDPGENNMEMMENGILNASVFAMFVSPHAEASVWVRYEATIAKIQKIKRSTLKVVAIPIKGSSYRNAPKWMQELFSTNEKFTPRDIARLLKHLFVVALTDSGDLLPAWYVGRETLENKILVHYRTTQTQSGTPINVVILHGLQGMGRSALASHLLPRLFPGLRSSHPVIDLPRQAEAYDIFLALRSDIEGSLSVARLEELSRSWPQNDARAMAEVICANLAHYEEIGQPIVIQSARGLRDFGAGSDVKSWVAHFFDTLKGTPNIKVVWISEVAAPVQTFSRFKNALQFEVNELTSDAVFVLISELLGVRDASPPSLQAISDKIAGHPATAHWVAESIKLGKRSPESIAADPGFITSFQQKFVDELLERRHLSEVAFAVLQILCIIPSLDFDAIAFCLEPRSQNEVATTINNLVEIGLVSYSMNLGYKIPEIVRSVFLIKHPAINKPLVTRVANILSRRIQSGRFTISSANSLVFAHVLLGETLPELFKSIMTGATLHELVYEQFQIGMRFQGGYKEHFESAAKLAELAELVPMSNDAYETVLYYGAEALNRLGGDPKKFIDRLERRGLGAAEYLKGSFAYHKQRDSAAATKHLKEAIRRGAFVGRAARLLAKIYHDSAEPRRALEVFDQLGESRVNRDSGMLVQKIRCLRAIGEHGRADALMKSLKALPDDYGHYDMMEAGRHFRNREFPLALDATARAKLKPKADQVNLALLEAAIKVEKGDLTDLEGACALAVGVGRSDDALSLRARAALRHDGGWSEAEKNVRQIATPNFYDKVLLLRALNLKVKDLAIKADPSLEKKVQDEIAKLTLETRATPEEFDR